ncbi:MAG: methyltransferase domain-containing protein [Elusimicrobiota bacterium]
MSIKSVLKKVTRHFPVLSGIATYILGLYKPGSTGTGGTISARYCYSVWLRHLMMAYKNGLSTQPDTVAELGPGDSLGIGLAALLSGANNYYAFDVVKYANTERNIAIFDELVSLFQKREKIPDETEFPRVKPYLESYKFPAHILTDERLDKALKPERIESIRNAILHSGSRNRNNTQISYCVPWSDSKTVKEESVDMIYSQAVMEYVDDLAYTYQVLYRWLKPSGFMSHEIDFKSDGITKQWNGHLAYSDFVWRLIKGKKTMIPNRQPYSTHINYIQKVGFEIVCSINTTDISGITREQLAARFKNMSNDDLTTSSAFIQAVKK